MYKNVGGKIKDLVSVATVLGIVGFVGKGLVLMASGNILGGVLLAAVGALGCWFGSFALYGYGELIETNAATNRNLDTLNAWVEKVDEDILTINRNLYTLYAWVQQVDEDILAIQNTLAAQQATGGQSRPETEKTV